MKISTYSNSGWTQEKISEWAQIWSTLWHKVHMKWEWQNYDLYARSGSNEEGNKWGLFTVFNDAVKLEGAIPLPDRDAYRAMFDHYEHCVGFDDDDYGLNCLVDEWSRKYDW